MTEQTISIKVKLQLKDTTKQTEMHELMHAFRDGCNYVSQYIFDHNFKLNKNAIQKAIYYDLRTIYRLKAQLAISCIRSVVARYKTVQTQLQNNPLYVPFGKYDKKGKEIWVPIQRNLNWLWHPIKFQRPQADLQRNRDWQLLKNGDISFATMTGRAKATPIFKGFDQYFDGSWKAGVAKLLYINNEWYLHISMTKSIPQLQDNQVKNVVGLDRGLRFITNSYDSKNQSLFFNGKKAIAKRRHYKWLRSKLQSKHTKSAKRRLKKIGQRENRWMTDVNHRITKTLINYYGSHTLFVLEDLKGIRQTTEKVAKDKRYEQVSWAFYQFEQYLIYKAALYNCKVLKVDAHYTSQRCPKCGQINKINRNHDRHIYICQHCHYSSNDDRIGAMNIQNLGTWYLTGIEQPHYTKLNNSNT